MARLTDIQLQQLLEKYHAGKCSDEELEMLQQWFDATGEEDGASQLPEHMREQVTAEMYEEFSNRLFKNEQPAKVRRIRTAIAIAAAVLILFASALIYRAIQNGEAKHVGRRPTASIDVEPGKNGAVLTLADGSVIVLDSIGNGTIAMQNGVQVISKEGQIAYSANETGTAAMAYNTLTTPKARQFHIVLPDGSKVWLNAASSLKYPVAFNGAERTVELTGEAYFEVAHHAAPFKVKAGATEIIDLGTAFNVYAYVDEPVLNATLLQGAIKIQDKILGPGQQARIRGNAMNLVKLSNPEDVVAWKAGNITFDNIDVATLMRQIARWYNVEVVYRGAVPQERLIGTISRQTNLSTIVKVLNEYGISCHMEGNMLVVAAQ